MHGYPLQAEPPGVLHVDERAMQVSPQAFPVVQTLEQYWAPPASQEASASGLMSTARARRRRKVCEVWVTHRGVTG